MYSDIWRNDNSLHKTPAIFIKKGINMNFWVNKNSYPEGVCVNFESADDVHYEFTIENWFKFIEGVLHTSFDKHIISFTNFLNTNTSQIDFCNILDKNNIEYKKIAF